MANITTLLLLALIAVSQVSALSFKNANCDGKECPFRVDAITFDKYSLNVKGKNWSNAAILGGEVRLKVDISVFIWVNAYDSTDPTCSYNGTDCKDGILVGPNADKAFTLTMDQVPPSGTYRGTATFYYLNEADTKTVQYASVTMDWKCDSSKCY